MATTIVGRAAVIVTPQIENGSGDRLQSEITGGVNGTQIGQAVGSDIGAGVVQAGSSSGKKFGEKLKGGLNVASVGIVGAATGAVVGLTAIGDTFDGVIDTIRAGTGASGDALDELMDSAKNVASNVPASFEDIGVTVADLNTRLGLTGKELEAVTSQVLEAGRVFDTELDVTALSSGFSAFGIEGAKVEGAMDKLFVASQATGVGMNELADMSSKVAPQMKALGFSFEDTIGMIGTLDKAGIDAASVAGSMGKALVNLAKEGEKPQEAFKRTVGEIEGFISTGNDVKANDLAIKLFGTKGSTNFLNALKSGKIDMNALDKIAGSTGDTIMAVGEDTADFAETWKMFTNRLMIAIEPLASEVFGLIGEALDVLIPKVETVITWLQDNIETVKTFAMVIGGLAAGVLVLNAAMTVYSVVMSAVSVATKVWAGVQWLLNTALLANPITLIVLAVVALVAIVIYAWQNFDGFKNFMIEMWANITGVIGAFVGWLTGTALPAIGGFFAKIGEWFMSVVTTIGDFFQFVLVQFGGFLVTSWEKMAALGVGIGEWFSGIWSKVGEGWNLLTGVVKNGIDSIFGFFDNMGSMVSNIFTNIGGVVEGIFNNIVGVIKSTLNTLISAVNGPISTINGLGITVPGWVPGIGGNSWSPSIPMIPSFALGGTIAATPGGKIIRVAEGGRDESIVDTGLHNRRMSELERLQKADTNSSGRTIVNDFNVTGGMKDPKETARELYRLQKWND